MFLGKCCDGDRQLYVVRAVQTQVVLQGAVGREMWLEVDFRRGGAAITGWMQSGELQRRVSGGASGDWLTRLRRRGKEGWSVGCGGAQLGVQ